MFARSAASSMKFGARSFSTSRAQLDMAKVTFIGRLAADPQVRTSEKSGVSYTLYTVATSTGPLGDADENGLRKLTPNYHTVFAFNDKSQERIQAMPRGAKVYVEADLQLKENPPAEDGSRNSPTTFLTHRMIQLLSLPRRVLDEQAGAAEESA